MQDYLTAVFIIVFLRLSMYSSILARANPVQCEVWSVALTVVVASKREKEQLLIGCCLVRSYTVCSCLASV